MTMLDDTMIDDAPEKEYRVEWSMYVNAKNPLDAARQAWAMLDDATNNNSGTSVLFVTDEYGENKYVFDMEHPEDGYKY